MMMEINKWRGRMLLALLLMIPFCSCSLFEKKVEDLELNTKFSCNIFKPGDKWPGKHYIPTEAQNELLGIKGEPDWVRLWFNPLGELGFIEDREVYNQIRTGAWHDLDRSWIYLDDETEYVFTGPRSFKDVPLNDMLKIIVQRGDPDEVNHVPKNDGPQIVEWIYYKQGYRFKFVDDILTKTSRQPTIPYERW
jgi:hypothetical protein